MDVPKECLLSCDGFWLKEAMENVLKNAVEYADTGSLIQILLKEDTDYYKLYITNRGKRIKEEKRELILTVSTRWNREVELELVCIWQGKLSRSIREH